MAPGMNEWSLALPARISRAGTRAGGTAFRGVPPDCSHRRGVILDRFTGPRARYRVGDGVCDTVIPTPAGL